MTRSVACAELAISPHFLPDFGLPDERTARIAARRAFVELKASFMDAASDIDGLAGDVLRRRVRGADEPAQVWRLRAALLHALSPLHPRTPQHHLELTRQLDSLFPEPRDHTCFMPL